MPSEHSDGIFHLNVQSILFIILILYAINGYLSWEQLFGGAYLLLLVL